MQLSGIFNWMSRKPATLPPLPGLLNMSVHPVSTQFGYDRGGPIDRYFIERFLGGSKGVIKGRVLEIGDDAYTRQFGGDAVMQCDVLHIDPLQPQATITGDLTNLPQVPANSFDCIILTQTLHLVFNFQDALTTCARILKPGGSLLLTVPGISHIAQDEWGKYWQWSFTPNSIREALSGAFTGAAPIINTFGNVKLAAAFLYGFGLPEIQKAELDYVDEHYPLIITVSVTKTASHDPA